MTIIRLLAADQKLNVALAPKIASGDKKSVCLRVAFDGNWSDYEKSAVFFTSWDKTVYEMLLSDGECTVPHEVLAKSGELFIGVRGVDPDTAAVKTSTLVKYRIEKGAPVGDATSVEPTPDVYQQILGKLNAIKIPVKGVDYYTEAERTALTEEIVEVITAKLEKSFATIGTVNLLASKWVGNGNLYSQVVTIAGVTENSQVDLTPDVEQLVVFYEKDLTFVTENEGGVVTVYAIGQKPTNDYTIQVTITEVSV